MIPLRIGLFLIESVTNLSVPNQNNLVLKTTAIYLLHFQMNFAPIPVNLLLDFDGI